MTIVKKTGIVSVFAACTFLAIAGAEDGFEPIFNGEDFSGWKNTDGWAAEDGMLKVVADGGDIWTEEEYESFELRFEFNVSEGGNSGVFFRRAGLEVQLLDDYADKYADLKDWQYCGSLYGLVAAGERASKCAGEWQAMWIGLDGQQLTVILNGVRIVEADLDELEGHAGLAPGPGHIGFQNYRGSEIKLRNIELHEL